MVKRVVCWILCRVFYYIGHWISVPMYFIGWLSWLYPIYNKLMLCSYDLQEMGGVSGPWDIPDDWENHGHC